jgi:ABC-type Zn uptake system ZnuABC Zn-binding protein ZnuA
MSTVARRFSEFDPDWIAENEKNLAEYLDDSAAIRRAGYLHRFFAS